MPRMEQITTVRELQARADRERAAGRRIALVPTMGALHAGHLALVDEARRRAQFVVVSIFVNPTQFNASADLAAYPRTLEADLAACRARGVDAVFLPTDAELYPPGYQTWVEVTELAKPLCGAPRPGHFRGVATVVAKLLIAAKPHVAIFGEKDFQQLAVIRRLASRSRPRRRDRGRTDRARGGRPRALEPQRAPDAARRASRRSRSSRALDGGAARVAAGERSHAALDELVREEIGARAAREDRLRRAARSRNARARASSPVGANAARARRRSSRKSGETPCA